MQRTGFQLCICLICVHVRIFPPLKQKISMTIKISKAAQLYFALSDLTNKELSFTTAYRIKRNLDRLKSIGEKYTEELNAEFETILPKKEVYADGELKQYHTIADSIVFKRWDESGEMEDLDLKVLSLEGEDMKFSARQIEALESILIFEI